MIGDVPYPVETGVVSTRPASTARTGPVRVNEPDSGRSSDAPPTATEIAPGSLIRVPSRPGKEVRAAGRRDGTRALSPGASATRVKPASQRTGRTTEATGSLRYSCTTSAPA